MKESKFLSYIYLLIFVAVQGFSAIHQAGSGLVRFTGNQGDSTIVNYLAKTENAHRGRLEQFFAVSLHDSIHVILPGSESEFAELTGYSLPEWSAAVAFPAYRTIIMKPGLYFDPGTYRESLLHELSHLYLAEKMTEHRVALWLNEGVAMYLAGTELTWQDNITLGNAVVAEKLLSFSEIDDLLRFHQSKARVAYLQSLMTVKLFVASYGENQLKKMIDELSRGMKIDSFFRTEFNFSYDDFEFQSLKKIKDKFWWMIFMQMEYLIWIIILLLAVGAILTIKIRNYRKISRWTDEDNDLYKEI